VTTGTEELVLRVVRPSSVLAAGASAVAEAAAVVAEAQVAAVVCRPEELDDSSSAVAVTGVSRTCRLPEISVTAIVAI